MKISLEWLKDYVGLPGSADQLAEALTSGGTEVVGREDRGNIPDKVVVAQILSSVPHPNADRLRVCQVDDGSGCPRQVVCGAKNFKDGDKVALALPGAVLGPDFKIKAGKLRGEKSDGMLCSAKELALAEDADGLLILAGDFPVGKPVKELFPPGTVLELEVTPNRPDLLGYRGVAREVAALTEVEAILAAPPSVPEKPADGFVRLEDSGCPFYTARIIRGVNVGPSPQWLADRLMAAGLRPINNVVDVTNYVLLETGQPLHAFDLAKLEHGIVVRNAHEGEMLKALDGSELKLRAHDLIVADAGRVVAVAGVTGGAETGVTTATRDILLESAWFEPSRVRKSSRQLGLSTDSSYRFERRVDPSGVLPASARAAELILQTAGGAADAEVLVAGREPRDFATITFSHDRCRALLGLEIANGEIDDIFSRLGLTQAGGQWSVPGFRPDLTREVDLIEEVIRMAGIERVPSRRRGFPAAASVADLRHDNAEMLRERLRAQGFSEARTSHFVSPDALQRSGGTTEDAVAVRNPLGVDQALLRPALLAGLLEALARNLRHGAVSVRLFEIGPVFRAAGKEEGTALALLCTGAEAGLFDLKGGLQTVLGAVEFRPEDSLALRVTGPGVEGLLRRLPRALGEKFAAKSPVFYAEMDVDGWLETVPAPVRVRPLPRFPAVTRDLSLILPKTTRYAAVEKALSGARAPHLFSVGLKDVFEDPSGVTLPAEQRSLTVTLTFRDEVRTLTSEEVDRAVETLRDHAKSVLGAVFRA
jgi:phenylalanyl-tRNA synthetase beta chain